MRRYILIFATVLSCGELYYLRDLFFFFFQAKQRASISWLVQKAHKNKVPSDIEDPYYKDYEVSHAVLSRTLEWISLAGNVSTLRVIK